MSITKIITPELLDFPKDSTSSVNTSGTVIPTGYTAPCTFPGSNANVALYTMDGNADDSCGSLNLTNTNNVPFVTSSPWGGSYQSADFDPSASPDEYLTIASGLGSVADRTRSLWIYLDAIPSVFATVLYIGPTGSPNQNYEVLSVSSNLTGHVRLQSRYGTGTDADIESLSALSTSTWYHVAWVYQGTSIYLYVNGALQGSTTNTVTDTSSYPAFFGAWHSGSTEFDGKIAQARFYNQALTPGQIVDLYNESLTTYYRPTTSLNAGEFRYNEQLGKVEYYDGSTWLQIADEYITGQPTTCICSYPSNTTPIALYQLDDVTETCGSWNSATNVGSATFTSGKFGNALTLTGGQYLTLSDTWTYDNDFSCSVWVYMDSIAMNGNYPGIVGFWGTGGYDWMIEFDNVVASPVFNLVMYTSSSSQRAGTTTPLAINTWYHIAVTASSTEGKKMYLNGTLETTNANTSALLNNYSDDNRIGSSRWGSLTDWDGKIDQLRFYNSVLTATQVTELYNEVVCN